MAALRKLMLTVLVLAAFGCVATAGALSQPQQLHVASATPSLRVEVTRLRPLAGGAYTGTLRVANHGTAAARLFVSVRGGTGVVVRDARRGLVLYRGRVALDAPTGTVAAGTERTLTVALRPAAGGRVGIRVTGSAL
jgi:hypothetical protein